MLPESFVRTALLAFLVVIGTAAPARADDRSEADRLFDESAEHYRAGRFELAAELLERAYELTKDPVLLFNLAKAHEGRGDAASAIRAYERYLAHWRTRHAADGAAPLDRAAFCREEQRRKWEGVRRCC